MEELNKKLAEWAGVGVWHKEAGELEGHFEGSSIQFTQSLDACFKWLVPKLLEQDIDISLFVDKGKPAGIFLTPLDIHKRIIVDEETPALALCKAIEKLIDGEKDG